MTSAPGHVDHPLATRRLGARVVGVAGARGGVGASTLAALLARHCAEDPTGRGRRPGRGWAGDSRGRPPVVLIDAAGRAGVDVLLGLERDRALRWPDLHAAYGDVDGADLLARLPRWAGVHVLSADHARPHPPEPEVALAVLAGLSAAADTVVVDLGTAHAPTALVLGSVLDRGAVLVPRDVQSVAGALVVRSSLDGLDDVQLVTRGPAPGGLGSLEIAHVLDLPLLGELRATRGTVPRARSRLEVGEGPAARGRRDRRDLDAVRRGLGLA